MARQTWAALAALYPDNTAGAISPADLRAGVIDTMRPHVAAEAPTTAADETLGFDVGHAWIDTSTTPNSLYRCLDPTTGAAVWAKVYPPEAPNVGAEDVTYDNTSSGLTADDVQAAIDELASEKANISDLGTAAAANASDFATAAQGALADTAVQPGDDAADLGSGEAPDGYVLTADGAGGAAWEAPSGAGGVAWGGITGTLSDQADLDAALDARPTSTTVTAIEALTQAEYDLLTPDATTLYVITDA